MLPLSRVSLCLAAGLALGACSAIVEFAECKSDLDCAGAGAGSVCGPSGTCIPGQDPETSSTGTPPPTSTLGETTTTDPTTEPTATTGPVVDTLGGETTTTGGPTTDATTTDATTGEPMACAGHTECTAARGDEFVCSAGACVSAVTPECGALQWPGGKPSDKVVFLGSVMTTSPPYDSLVLPLQNAVQLAVEDFNANAELPGGYKVAWVACDDHADPARAVAAAEHLTATIGTPVIIGPIFSELVLLLSEQVTVPAGTLLFTPTASAKSITGLADDGLVWRTIASDVYQASGIADRLAQIEPAPGRVAVLAKEDAYGKGLEADVLARLMAEQPGLLVSSHEYPNPASLPPNELKAAYAAIIADAWGGAGEHPDTIVLIGTTEVLDLILNFIIAWDTENLPPLRFVVSHGAVPALPQLIEKAQGQTLKTLLMMTTEGVAPVIFDAVNFANFNIRYKIRFNDQEPITASSLSYDAAMVAMLAMTAVPEGEAPTGALVAENIARLVDKQGTGISFGDVDGAVLTFIKKARNALVSGGSVDLHGVSGELDFDLKAGEVRTDLIGWGIDPKQAMPDIGVLTPKRTYILAPAPSVEGVWMDL